MTGDGLAASGGDGSTGLELEGRITTASNATFLARLDDARVVYKPIEGEKPLWDFPSGLLAHREVAAYLVSEQLGWNVVPRTWLGDGPFGPGMLQLWQQSDPEQEAVDLLPLEAVPDAGWCVVFEGSDPDDRPVALVHEDSAALRRMAVFDVLTNNADRKGGHVLGMPDGHRFGVDHGLTFHAEHKLRTVLWGWIGEPLNDGELDGVMRVQESLERGALASALEPLLTAEELDAFALRCESLIADAVFPAPAGDMPPVPWPLF
ncbi:SCO1664 family protein [Herbiconiux moechotypicola]|uniref:SCO1664 family protein n=1 Tax=Herbiconiux moechotypicola TaxID=637393 RepID=A0ABN3DLA1_9MICO|nr:SCO1664 family protein [Herbiconiux moechotypicola]MCS5730138.1 SCO1664 family protein [Herbiconiux moechotypicola]